MFFANCPAATWPQFGEMLSWQFLAAANRGLAEEQLEMIARKLFGKSPILSSFVRWMQAGGPTPAQHQSRDIFISWCISEVRQSVCFVSAGIKQDYNNCNVSWSKFSKVGVR